jgi:molecular chaperone GrpE
MGESGENHGERGSVTSIPVRVTDRRPHFAAGPDAAAPEETPAQPRYPSFVAELESRTRAAEAKLTEALNLLRRREADADEFRARLRREMETRSRAQVEIIVREFLEVLDGLDRGVAAAAGETNPASLREGLVRVRDQFVSLLARQGVEPMRLVGTDYDPHVAEAVAVSPAGDGEEDNRVVEETRRGFTIEGRVLRPAQVRVARRAAGASGEDPGSLNGES